MKHTHTTPPAPAADPGAGVPSERQLQLGRLSMRELETVFVRGVTPDPERLAGWEFRGLNALPLLALFGIRKFIKGFYRRDGALWGYNTPAVQNGLPERWSARPSEDNPKRFGFYKVVPVDPTARDNKYLHALLLDYGLGNNPRLDPSAGLRDYLVQVDAANPDLYLGKAYYALGPARLPLASFFILERHRKGLADVSFR